MSQPIVVISNQRVKEGKLEAYERYFPEVADMVEPRVPRTLAHLAYVNEADATVSIIHVFPDEAAMMEHNRGVGELGREAFDYMEIVSFDIYGDVSDTILENLTQMGGSDITVRVKPRQMGGHIRLKTD